MVHSVCLCKLYTHMDLALISYLFMFVMAFDNYIGSPWDQYKPKHIPIPPINQSNKKQIPLKMAWPLPIHKSQGLKLTRSIIDIGTMDFLYLL